MREKPLGEGSALEIWSSVSQSSIHVCARVYVLECASVPPESQGASCRQLGRGLWQRVPVSGGRAPRDLELQERGQHGEVSGEATLNGASPSVRRGHQ